MRTLLVLLGVVSLPVGGPGSVPSPSDLRLSAQPTVQSAPSRQGEADDSCPVSRPVDDRPPDDPHASSFAGGTWYANPERTIWAWWWGQRSTGDYKILWVRPVGAQLKISGQRLDGAARELTADIPDGYRHTFQASAVAFPSAGCWEIESTAGDARMKFVVRVR